MTKLSTMAIESLGDGWYGFPETANTWGFAARYRNGQWEMARRGFAMTPAKPWEIDFQLACHDTLVAAVLDAVATEPR